MHRPLILIVDDESKIRRLLAQNLELEGFDVQTASDGAQALEVYNILHFILGVYILGI